MLSKNLASVRSFVSEGVGVRFIDLPNAIQLQKMPRRTAIGAFFAVEMTVFPEQMISPP